MERSEAPEHESSFFTSTSQSQRCCFPQSTPSQLRCGLGSVKWCAAPSIPIRGLVVPAQRVSELQAGGWPKVASVIGQTVPQSLVRLCLSSAVQHAKRTFGALGGFPGPRESGPDGPEVGPAVFYARRACTDRRTWWHSCVCTHVHALIATFRVARLSLQTRKLWLIGVASNRDARHACLRFFSFYVFLFFCFCLRFFNFFSKKTWKT